MAALLLLAVLVPPADAQVSFGEPCADGPPIEFDGPPGRIEMEFVSQMRGLVVSWCLHRDTTFPLNAIYGDTRSHHFERLEGLAAGLYTLRVNASDGRSIAGHEIPIPLDQCKAHDAYVRVTVGGGHLSEPWIRSELSCPPAQVDPVAARESPEGSAPAPPTQAPWSFWRHYDARASNAKTAAKADTGDPQAWLVASFAGTSLLVLVPTKAKLWLLALLGRRLRGRTLEHPLRRDLLEAIRHEPGLHAADLRRRLDVSQGRFQHHAAVLEGAGMIRSELFGGMRRYFPRHVFAERERQMIVALRTRHARPLFEVVRAQPFVTSQDLAQRSGLSAPAVSKVMRRLAEAGLVTSRRDMRRQTWLPLPVPVSVLTHVE